MIFQQFFPSTDVLSNDLTSLNLTAGEERLSFGLLDHKESLLVDSAEDFAKKLGVDLRDRQTKASTSKLKYLKIEFYISCCNIKLFLVIMGTS